MKRKLLWLFVILAMLVWSFPAAIPTQQALAQGDNKALSFNGIDNYVDCGNNASLNLGTGSFTIELWAKVDSGIEHGGLVSKAKYNEGWIFYIYAGNLRFASHNDYSSLITTETYTDDSWHHFAVVREDSDDGVLYVDGIEKKRVGNYFAGYDVSYAKNLYIGAENEGASKFFKGIIDEVRISDKARSPGEIAAAWNGGVGQRFVLDADTVALWHMDEGSGDTIVDETANDNDGAISGAGWTDGFQFPVISKIEFTTPPQTVVAYRASEAITIQTQEESGNPLPVTEDTTIALSSSLGGGEFSLSPTEWSNIGSVVMPAGSSDATFYFKSECDYIGDATIRAIDDPDKGWTDAEQGVTIQGPVELWRGPTLIGTYFAIQEAIDAAEDGDNIVVLPGTYYEQILINKQVTVKSEYGLLASTIIDVQGCKDDPWEPESDMAVYPAVWIQRDGVEFGNLDQGFTIRNTPPMVFLEGEEDPSEMGVAILVLAPGCTIEGNVIEDSNPVGILALGDTTISGNTVSASIMGIQAFGEQGSTITGNTVSSTMMGGIYSGGQGSNISDNNLYDNQGTAISLQNVSNAEVTGNTITTDTTSVAGTYGIEVQGGNNNDISDNDIYNVLIGGINLNNTSDNSLSLNEIYDIYGCSLWGGAGGDAWWTREEVNFDRYSVKMWTGENPGGAAMLAIPSAFPFEYIGMGGGEFYFWAHLDDENVLPTYQLGLDNGTTLKANTGGEGLVAGEWLKLYAIDDWTKLGTPEHKSLSEWIDDPLNADANVDSFLVMYSGGKYRTMYIDGSEQEYMPIEPPKGIVISKSNSNYVSDNTVLGINGAGILIVESQQNMLGDDNDISENGIGIVIENSNENAIRGSLISDNDLGIGIYRSHNNQIIGNSIIWNTGGMSGVHLDGESCGNELHANYIVDNTAFGVFKEAREGGCEVNATGNWWGDASGPSGVGPGNGDAVSDFVNFEPWATEFPDVTAPNIIDNLAMPRMTALLGMFRGDVGPDWSNLVVEAQDNEGGVGIAQVTVDLAELLLEQMLWEEPEIPPEKEGQWENWLSQLAETHLGCRGDGVYQRDFNLEELLKPLAGYLGEDDAQGIMDNLMLGDFSIPVTVTDWCGHESYSEIELTIVDIMRPLKQGWNLVSTPVTLDEGYTTLEDIFDLGGGFIYDVLVVGLWYDPTPEFGWVEAWPEDEVKPLTALCVYVDGNTQIGLIFDRFGTAPPVLELDYDWNLVSLAIPPTDWDSMPVNKAMVSVEQGWEGYRGYTVVVSPYQQVNYNEQYQYQDYDFGGYGWHFEQEDWGYAAGFDDDGIPKMSIGGGYWVFMQEGGYLAGFGTTPVTRVFRDELGHDLDLVPRYDWQRVTRTGCVEYSNEGYTRIFLTYSGDVTLSRVVEFYQQRMVEYGWELTAWDGSEDSASLDFDMVMGAATFSCHIDVVGGESIKIQYESQEPGVDLPDVPRFDWRPVAMTAYNQTTDSTGTQTTINYEYYEYRTGPEEVYKFYQERMEKQGEWEKIGEECRGDWAALMFRRDKEGTRYMCLIWAENGVIEIEHHQFSASVTEEYLKALWWQRIEDRKMVPPEPIPEP